MLTVECFFFVSLSNLAWNTTCLWWCNQGLIKTCQWAAIVLLLKQIRLKLCVLLISLYVIRFWVFFFKFVGLSDYLFNQAKAVAVAKERQMKSWQNPKGKNADIFLCCHFKNTVPSKKKRGGTKHKGNNRRVARLQTLLKKQSCFVLRLSPLCRMHLWDAPLCRCPSAFIWGEVCVCVGGVPVCVSCQSACLAPGWGKAPCGMEAGEECASWGEPPKPQSDKLTAGMLGSGSSYSLTSTLFFLDSLRYLILYLFFHIQFLSHLKPSRGCSNVQTLKDSYFETRLTTWQQNILQPLLQSHVF